MNVVGYEVSKNKANLFTGLIVLIWGLSDLFIQHPDSNAGNLTRLLYSYVGIEGLAVLKLMAAGAFIFMAYRANNKTKYTKGH